MLVPVNIMSIVWTQLQVQIKYGATKLGIVVQSSPSVVNDYVYIGSEDKNVYCLSASDGSNIWNYTTPGWVDSSPAVANGYVYVGSWELDANQTDLPSNVYCLNALTGAEVWNYRITAA